MSGENIKELSVFIPVYNEEASVRLLIAKVEKACYSLNIQNAELIIVDDGSTDGTYEVLQGCATQLELKVLRHRRNRGLTAAMKTGFAAVKGKYVVFLPGDLQSDPEEDIPKLYRKPCEGYDMVLGCREGRADGKIAASRIYNFVSGKLFHLSLHDMNWIKAFRAGVIADLELRSDWHRFIVMMAASAGHRITEVPVTWHPRIGGASKFGLKRIPISFFDVIALKFLLAYGKRPLQFFGPVACLLIIAGVVLAKLSLIVWFFRGIRLFPWLVGAGALLLAGLLVFMLGLLAEQVASLQEKLDKHTK